MAQKSTKIVDVKHPSKTVPATSSRPILVTNRPVLTNDPMMVAARDAAEKAEKPTEVVNRTAKVIKPIDETLTAATTNAGAVAKPENTAPELPKPDDAKADKPEAVELKSEDKPAEPTPEGPAQLDSELEAKPVEELAPSTDAQPETAASETPEATETPKEPAPEIAEAETAMDEKTNTDQTEGEPKRDNEAEIAADETAALEAQNARTEELEKLIASGKYNVPIDAVQRKRSRMHTMALCLLALVLAVALADAVLDMGLVKLSVNVPHTHFFSTT